MSEVEMLAWLFGMACLSIVLGVVESYLKSRAERPRERKERR